MFQGNVKKWRTNSTGGQIGNYNLTHIRSAKGRNDTAVYLFLFSRRIFPSKNIVLDIIIMYTVAETDGTLCAI